MRVAERLYMLTDVYTEQDLFLYVAAKKSVYLIECLCYWLFLSTFSILVLLHSFPSGKSVVIIVHSTSEYTYL